MRREGVKSLQPLNKGINGRLASKGRSPPRATEITPVGQNPARAPQSLHRPFLRLPAQRAAHALRRVFQLGLEPKGECLAVNPFGLGVTNRLELRIHPRLHRPLPQQFGAETVNRAYVCFFKAGEGISQILADTLLPAVGGRPARLLLQSRGPEGPRYKASLAGFFQ